MRGAPQVGFSATIRKSKSRTSWLTALRPARRRARERQAQYHRKPVRCQRTTARVSPRLRVSASRTTIVAALPRTADRGNRAEDAAVGHARPAIAVATLDSPE